MVFGPKPVLEILQSTPESVESVYVQKGKSRGTERILDECRRKRVRFKLLRKEGMDSLFPVNHQGVAARTLQQGFTELSNLLLDAQAAFLPVILALDQVQDPGNVGALGRTLVGTGGGGIIITRDRSASLGIAASKSSAGALSKVPISKVVNLARSLDECRQAGYTIYCAAKGEVSHSLFQNRFHHPAVLVLGNEEKGIRPNVLKRCDHQIHIPMPGEMESFNVAQAGAILLGEMLRQRLAI
ncbi:MAG: TrmH family RNA methyltransferase [Desulfovibrionales bacterium]